MPSLLLHGGPLDGQTKTVSEPWPRPVVTYQVSGAPVRYYTRDNETDADFGDLAVSGGTDPYSGMTEGPPGDPGPEGPRGLPGPPGPAGLQFAEGGAYSSLITYPAGTKVTYNGGSYYVPFGVASPPAGRAPLALDFSLQSPWQVLSQPGSKGDKGDKGDQGDQGVPGTVAPRGETIITTASLAGGARESSAVEIAMTAIALRITTDKAARVRFYTTAALRDADLLRPTTQDPVGQHGCTLEVVTTATVLSVDLSGAVVHNEDLPLSDLIYYTITNNGAAGPVTVTFRRQTLD